MVIGATVATGFSVFSELFDSGRNFKVLLLLRAEGAGGGGAFGIGSFPVSRDEHFFEIYEDEASYFPTKGINSFSLVLEECARSHAFQISDFNFECFSSNASYGDLFFVDRVLRHFEIDTKVLVAPPRMFCQESFVFACELDGELLRRNEFAINIVDSRDKDLISLLGYFGWRKGF